MQSRTLGPTLVLVVFFAIASGVRGQDRSLSELLVENAKLQQEIDRLHKEFLEKTKPQRDRLAALKKPVEEQFKKFLPSGKQTYGDFTWTCNANGSFISLSAQDENKKQYIWAHVFYHPNMPEEERKRFNKTCLGLPAKRFPDKWVWVLVGRVEIRFGLNDSTLESDATLDAIVKSFDLEAIKKL